VLAANVSTEGGVVFKQDGIKHWASLSGLDLQYLQNCRVKAH